MLQVDITSSISSEILSQQSKNQKSKFQLFKILTCFEQFLNQQAKENQVTLSTKMIKLPYDLIGDKDYLTKLFFSLMQMLFRNSKGQTLEVEIYSKLKRQTEDNLIDLVINCKVTQASSDLRISSDILSLSNQNLANLIQNGFSSDVRVKKLVQLLEGRFKKVD